MLLTTNNIPFETKILNIRRIVEKEFDHNEEPIVDKFICSSSMDFKTDSINADSSEKIAINPKCGAQANSSLTDIEEIFSTFNHQSVDRNLIESKNIMSSPEVCKTDSSIVLLPNEELSDKNIFVPENDSEYGFLKTKQKVIEIECGGKTSLEKINEVSERHYTLDQNHHNREATVQNININLEKFSSSLPSKSADVSNTNTDNKVKQDCTLHTEAVQADGFRKVNVEMFTVTLKKVKNIPK